VAQTRHEGFTLIEALVTVTLLGILVTLAVPGMVELVRNNRIAAQTNDILSLFAFARSEAMQRGARVALCPSADGSICSAGANWSVGIIVFADANRDGTAGGGEEVLRVMPALSGGNTLLPVGGALGSIQLRGSGVPVAPGNLLLCDDRPASGRLIAVLPTGSVRMTAGQVCP